MGLSTPAPPQLRGLGNQCTLTRKHPWWVVSASRVWGGDLFGSLRGSINSTISLSLDPELLGRGRVGGTGDRGGLHSRLGAVCLHGGLHWLF